MNFLCEGGRGRRRERGFPVGCRAWLPAKQESASMCGRVSQALGGLDCKQGINRGFQWAKGKYLLKSDKQINTCTMNGIKRI